MNEALTSMTAEEKRAKSIEKRRVLEQILRQKHERIKLQYKNVPQSMRNLFLSVFATKPTMSKCVKLKCLDCCCFDKTEVTKCTTITCPLWEVRPYQKKEKE